MIHTAPIETLVDPALRPAAGAFLQDGYDIDSHWHAHDMHQLQYALNGSIEVEDERARHLLPRQLAAWIPAGVVHRTSLHRVRSVSVLFSPTLAPGAGERVRVLAVSPLMREMVIGAMRWPLSEPQDDVGRAYFTALGLLCAEWIRTEARLSLPTTTDERLRAAMDHTRAHLAVADLGSTCQATGFSPRSLRRRFRLQAGMTWEEYRRRARMLHAVELLEDRALSIGEVAARVGFENQSAFAKTFRAFVGTTPQQFRHRNPAAL